MVDYHRDDPLAWRSLSGVRLDGNTIVRLAYVDEAGIANPIQEPWLVVCGLLVDADKQLVALERKIEKLIKLHIPEENQKGFVFHAMELFNGSGRGKVFDRHDARWTLSKRLEIADDIARAIQQSNVPISFGMVERATITKDYVGLDGKPFEKTLACHIIGFVTCAMRIELWMRKHAPTETTMLIVEDNEVARQRMIEMQNHYQDRSIILPESDPARQFFPFRKIKESPLFQSKKQSIVLQLADFCAYVMKRSLMGDARYNRPMDPWRKQIIAEPI